MTIKYTNLSDKAVAPVKESDTDAGFGLTCSRITSEINECGQVILVYHTDLSFDIPEGYYGAIIQEPFASNKSIMLCNALDVIHAGDKREVAVRFRSTTDVVPALYNPGERFAQLLILPIPDVQFEESEASSETLTNETETSAPKATQSLPETEVETTNSEPSNEGSGEAQNSLEEAQ